MISAGKQNTCINDNDAYCGVVIMKDSMVMSGDSTQQFQRYCNWWSQVPLHIRAVSLCYILDNKHTVGA